jgi:hypothetical protein
MIRGAFMVNLSTAAVGREGEAASMPAAAGRWTAPVRVGFRFALLFFVLCSFPHPLDVSSDWLSVVAPKAVPAFAARVLHIDIPAVRYSSDATRSGGAYGIASTLLVLTIALLGTVIWSASDRKRLHYEALHAWLRLYLRLVIAADLLGFGAGKVIFPGQMRPPLISSLLVPFGDLSPVARLWLFMGSSPFYTFCTGAVELIAGALLIIPGLTTLGALIAVGAMTNVFLLDVSYDVTPTVLAFLLLAMAIFLLLPDARRFWDAFVLRRDVPAQPEQPLLTRRWLQNSVMLLTLLAGCYWTGADLLEESRSAPEAAAKPSKAPYYGAWAVDAFSVNGVERPPLFTDPNRWKLLVFDWGVYYPKPSLVIHFGTGTRRLFDVDFDAGKKSVSLLRPYQTSPTLGTLVVNEEGQDRLVLEGDFEGQTIRAVLHRAAPDPLTHKWRFRIFRDGVYWGDDVII